MFVFFFVFVFVFVFFFSGILLSVREGEQSFEGQRVIARRAGRITGRPRGAL